METIIVLLLAAGAVAYVLHPVVRRAGGSGPTPASRWGGEPLDEVALAAEVNRYRTALRAGTVCRRCCTANPTGSRFCAECGRRLESGTR